METRKTIDDWLKINAEYERSGLTMIDFAKRAGFQKSALASARTRLGEAGLIKLQRGFNGNGHTGPAKKKSTGKFLGFSATKETEETLNGHIELKFRDMTVSVSSNNKEGLKTVIEAISELNK